ncbi:hypothetical protein [Geovibrio ferrireducens]|uniref:hypothetical protein n=1 Tax=Geovibrio ferrireducens TaxID=46201 RepID=UPI0022453E26|nr:hypothetical protein [Geovibrio ferrireducens]
MGKIKNPINFSTAFNLNKKTITKIGVVDVILNVDTNLFIDPLLLEKSKHAEMSDAAYNSYRKRFETIIKLLSKSKKIGDTAWRNALKQFQFHEVSWTCLGYGSSVRGSGFGSELITSTLSTAKDIVELGIDDVDLFMALALFEEGIGPDRISDMTTNIILKDLCTFNTRVIKQLKLPSEKFEIDGKIIKLLSNPYSKSKEPLLLVPNDIVRDLPIATDWSEVIDAASRNQALRDKVNSNIAGIWMSLTRKDKKRLKSQALGSKEAFESFLSILKTAKKVSYDVNTDYNGEVFWGSLVERVAKEFPKDFSKYQNRRLDISDVYALVGEIINEFKFLVEERDLWRELWDETLQKHKKEKAAQRLFFAVAHSYCKSNNLDITPEANTGNGPVDFKVSNGYLGKVLVEIKLSTNNLDHGYERQLKIYRDAEQTLAAYYLVVEVNSYSERKKRLLAIKSKQIGIGQNASEIVCINAQPRKSASKR